MNPDIQVTLKLSHWLMLLGWISAHFRGEEAEPIQITDSLQCISRRLESQVGHDHS